MTPTRRGPPGSRSIIVDFGYSPVPPAEAGADLLVSAFAELPAALVRLADLSGSGAANPG